MPDLGFSRGSYVSSSVEREELVWVMSKFLSNAKMYFRFPPLFLGFLDYLNPVKPLNPEKIGFLPGGCGIWGRDHISMCVSHVSFLSDRSADLSGHPGSAKSLQ